MTTKQPHTLFAKIGSNYRVAEDEAILSAASYILSNELIRGEALKSPGDTNRFLRAKLGRLEYESFLVIFLDNKHRVIDIEEMFRGTIDGASVHPREVVKAALKHNAAAVIFAHNHPSGVSDPSSADQAITKRLTEILSIVEVRVLDHFVIGEDITSFAEQGLI